MIFAAPNKMMNNEKRKAFIIFPQYSKSMSMYMSVNLKSMSIKMARIILFKSFFLSLVFVMVLILDSNSEDVAHV